MGCLVGEVENRAGIDCISHVACLEVEVRAGGAAGVAAECNGVTGLDVCVGLYEEFREVTVDCLKVVGVAEHDIVAVAAALEVGDTDAAVECGADSVADVHLEVNAFVLTAETAAVKRRVGLPEIPIGLYSSEASGKKERKTPYGTNPCFEYRI